jgi:hypothetical protein
MTLMIGTVAGAFSDDGTPLIEGTRINHITRREETWWALDGKGRVHQDGEVIAHAPGGLALNCLQPGHDSVFVGTSEARLFRLENGQMVEDEFFAGDPGRSSWHTPWGGPPDVRSMAVDVDGSLYINVHVGGILRYDDTGIAPTIDLNADVHQVIAHPTRRGVVLAATAYGLAESGNGHDFKIRGDGLHAGYCRAVALLDEEVFVSASTGPRTSKGRLYRASLAGEDFEPCLNGLPEWFADNLDSHCLAVGDGLVFAGQGSTVWQSADMGDSWEEVLSGLPKVTCLA